MRIWSWTVEDWNAAFQILTTIFVAGTVITGLGVFFTGRIVAKRQAQELAAAKTSIAKQQERAAKAEKELLEVQERFKPRTLSQTEQNNLFGLLRAYRAIADGVWEKDRQVLWIVHPSGDTEATEFASMLANLFSQAGWRPQQRDMPFSVHVTGIQILVSDPRNLPPLAQALKTVFEETHFDFSIQQQPDLNPPVWLVVGSKH